MARHCSQAPQGVIVGPFSQFKARAMIRAVVVLPTPRTPVSINAWATRPDWMALVSVRTSASCPFSSEKFCGRYLRARTRYSAGFSAAAGAVSEDVFLDMGYCTPDGPPSPRLRRTPYDI